MVEQTLSITDRKLSRFIGGKPRPWSTSRHEFYGALVKKGVDVDVLESPQEGRYTISVRAGGIASEKTESEPYKALAGAMLKIIDFQERASHSGLKLAKENIPFTYAYHWMLSGLSASRDDWRVGRYISISMGCVGQAKDIPHFMPDELFKIDGHTAIALMPTLVMVNANTGEQEAWTPQGEDIMATDWSVF